VTKKYYCKTPAALLSLHEEETPDLNDNGKEAVSQYNKRQGPKISLRMETGCCNGEKPNRDSSRRQRSGHRPSQWLHYLIRDSADYGRRICSRMREISLGDIAVGRSCARRSRQRIGYYQWGFIFFFFRVGIFLSLFNERMSEPTAIVCQTQQAET
jgi:hypothetical protein